VTWRKASKGKTLSSIFSNMLLSTHIEWERTCAAGQGGSCNGFFLLFLETFWRHDVRDNFKWACGWKLDSCNSIFCILLLSFHISLESPFISQLCIWENFNYWIKT